MASDGPLYPNQPLIEVATEVRFKGNLAVEHVRAQFQKDISEQYPVLKAPGAVHGVAPSLQPYRFESEAGDAGVQLAINSVSYFAREYPGEEVFLADVESATNSFLNLVGSIEVTRAGWRYINAIPFTRENGSLPLNRFFQDNEIFGSILSVAVVDASYQSTHEFSDFSLNVKLESSKNPAGTDEEVIILDIDAYEVFSSPVMMKSKDVSLAIKHKHDVARSTFESLISESYREFLKGGDDE